MTSRVFISIALVLALSACSSKLNPFNWFGGDVSDPRVAVEPRGGFVQDSDSRTLVAQVSALSVLRVSGGAVIRADGQPPRLGYWNAELVPLNDAEPENGVLSFEFRIAEPLAAQGSGTPYSRRVLVSHFVSDAKLQGVRQIRIVGASNSRSVRR